MARRSFLFVHGPLVGPSSLRRLARAAASAGHQTALPDLTLMATSDRPHVDYVRLAVKAVAVLTSPPIVVGHSGAGAFLPSIGDTIDRAGGLVFVDAVVPPVRVRHRTPDRMKDMLDGQTVDGVLRRWLDWWPTEVIAELLPDPPDRDELAADMPQLPRSFYDIDIEVPLGWSERPCGYLRLSPAYDTDLEEATTRNWPTATLDSTHLGTHTDPDRVLNEISRLADQIN